MSSSKSSKSMHRVDYCILFLGVPYLGHKETFGSAVDL